MVHTPTKVKTVIAAQPPPTLIALMSVSKVPTYLPAAHVAKRSERKRSHKVDFHHMIDMPCSES